MQDTHAHFTRSHNRIRLSLQGLWNKIFISYSKICLNDLNAYLFNADGKQEIIIVYLSITNNIKAIILVLLYIWIPLFNRSDY